MKDKIILGSANFDQVYGIKENLIKKNQIKKLLYLASKNNIKIIDTAPLYNESEKIIGKLNKNRFKIISKIPNKPKNVKKNQIKDWLKDCTTNSLKNLNIKKFECLLLHNGESLLKKNGNEIYEGIKKLKSNGITKKIGISIYNFNSLNKIIKKFKVDLIQVPFNIFDQRLIQNNLLKRIKKQKIQIHVRSVFLQGVLLLKYNQLPKKLKKFKKEWDKWQNWLKKNKVNPLQACLSFISNQSQLDGIVVGCDNINQLNQILKLKQLKGKFSSHNLNIKNNKLIDPRKWSK